MEKKVKSVHQIVPDGQSLSGAAALADKQIMENKLVEVSQVMKPDYLQQVHQLAKIQH